jgi:hypothetical protein
MDDAMKDEINSIVTDSEVMMEEGMRSLVELHNRSLIPYLQETVRMCAAVRDNMQENGFGDREAGLFFQIMINRALDYYDDDPVIMTSTMEIGDEE